MTLLRTKFYSPSFKPQHISRSRLHERLNSGLTCPLTLICAPAGYGKTALMSEWRSGRGKNAPAAWLSLDDADSRNTIYSSSVP